MKLNINKNIAIVSLVGFLLLVSCFNALAGDIRTVETTSGENIQVEIQSGLIQLEYKDKNFNEKKNLEENNFSQSSEFLMHFSITDQIPFGEKFGMVFVALDSKVKEKCDFIVKFLTPDQTVTMEANIFLKGKETAFTGGFLEEGDTPGPVTMELYQGEKLIISKVFYVKMEV